MDLRSTQRHSGGGRLRTPAIKVEEVTKLYRRVSAGYQFRTLKSALLNRSLIADLMPAASIEALQSVSFEVAKGESFGLIGGNGSGKSTLLKLIAGLLSPTSGSLHVVGRLAALIELGAGFHPEISGRENVFINGAVLGLSHREIEARYDEIVEFAGLKEFMEEPVKHYSSGMFIRLGFAVAVHTEPDILLVDEVLSVGDEAFRHKCSRRIEEMLGAGRTLLFVSHDLGQVEEICDRVMWIGDGVVKLVGSPRRVCDAYRQSVAESESEDHRREAAEHEALQPPVVLEPPPPVEDEDGDDSAPADTEEVLRWGSGAALIQSVRLLRADGTETFQIESGEAVLFEIRAVATEPLQDFVFGIGISTPRGIEAWGTNTDLGGLKSARFEGSGRVVLSCPELRLAPGEYLVDAAVHSKEGVSYDYRRKMFAFRVTSDAGGVGIHFPVHEWITYGEIEWSDRG